VSSPLAWFSRSAFCFSKLAWKRELKARLEAKGDPADLLVALRHGPKIADDVARIIAEVRHDTTGAAH
jgi:hypothetical protein